MFKSPGLRSSRTNRAFNSSLSNGKSLTLALLATSDQPSSSDRADRLTECVCVAQFTSQDNNFFSTGQNVGGGS